MNINKHRRNFIHLFNRHISFSNNHKQNMVNLSKAKFDVVDTYTTLDSIKVSSIKFQVPLDYNDSKSELIDVYAKLVNNHSPARSKQFNFDEDITSNRTNLILFLQGGPGFPTSIPTSKADPAFLKPLLERNFTVVFLDQRGTGLSTPIDTKKLISLGPVESQFNYIKNFRADSIIWDSETIRKTLIPNEKWSLLGQSYGGFCSITYASFYPDSLKQILLTGGLPPLSVTVDDVYNATYQRTKERNYALYKKFPEDIERVKKIVKYLADNEVKLPNGGVLSVERFQGLGLGFGGAGFTLSLHNLILQLYLNITGSGAIPYYLLDKLQSTLGFETNIIYFLFQEAIYLNGPNKKSEWAASRVQPIEFSSRTNKDKYYFTGEMVFPSMLADHKELAPLAELANFIHSYDDWSEIYNIETLKKIEYDELPIVAAMYYDDQYVDFNIGLKNLEIFEFKKFVTNDLFHNGLRSSSDLVLGKLFGILENGEYI